MGLAAPWICHAYLHVNLDGPMIKRKSHNSRKGNKVEVVEVLGLISREANPHGLSISQNIAKLDHS